MQLPIGTMKGQHYRIGYVQFYLNGKQLPLGNAGDAASPPTQFDAANLPKLIRPLKTKLNDKS